MINIRQSILASRPAATVLALALVAGLTTPFLMLPQAHAADDPPKACTENNNNGCTELSPTPPEDTVAVPPNIVLMFDDSGSMERDYMPDWGYIKNRNNKYAVVDAKNNGVYYSPGVTYLPPPQADGTLYPAYTDMSAVRVDGFGASTNAKINLFEYTASHDTGDVQYSINADGDAPPVSKSYTYPRNYTDSHWGYKLTKWPGKDYDFEDEDGCENWYNDFDENRAYQPYFAYKKVYNESKQTCTIYYYEKTTYSPPYFFMYSTGPTTGPYVVYYVAPPTADGGDCSKSPDPDHCVYSDAVGTDAADSPAPEGITVGANISNWFAYYHTRTLMAKSGLMTAFDKLSPNYRFGFASINARNLDDIPSSPAPFIFDDSTGGGGSATNKLAAVQPFGTATDETGTPKTDTQRYQFWTWLANITPSGNTPLRKALQGAGDYYKTDQPWTSMPGDPGYTDGSTAKYACRASYTILTTDGFWNGNSPDVGNADSEDGTEYTPPAGKSYTVTQYLAAEPYSDTQSDTLADVANYYWKTDLQPGIANQVAPSTADPAFWQHMTTYTMGLGFEPSGITPAGTTIPQIFAWAQGGAAISGFGWPNPSSNNINNIADLAHAAVNGHGDFFSAKNPQELAAGFAKAIADISARNVPPTPAGANATVITTGALSFSTGYSTGDWSGQFQAVELKDEGKTGAAVWDAGSKLNAAYHDASTYSARTVYTAAYDSTATPAFTRFAFSGANAGKLDSVELAGLMAPPSSGAGDTAAARMKFLLGDTTNEATLYRTRGSLLGAIIRSQPVYVAFPSGGYYNTWPKDSPEIADGAETYDTFVSDHADRAGVVYVGANDGMLHAFSAPAPDCSTPPCTYGDGGTELWAFVPRAVYANLGNLTVIKDFHYRPTVDEAPISRDVFFSDQKWHTLLTGGVGLGGRGVYALDVTDPTKFTASSVLWEFDSDMDVDSDCVSNVDSCKGTDLGYTVSRPNVGRLANGKWVVLVPNGYFPDCGTPDTPTNDADRCQTIAAQVPRDGDGKPYSALFVLDAETGKMIAELKTPTDVAGVTSFGLATPVLGDYDSDQVDDVAFAGDVQGNLWRFDFSDADPSKWTVALAYKGLAAGGKQGRQPITTMPRLFPDPATGNFMVVFGTGKFLGVGDNSSTITQALYGIRDQGSLATSAEAYEQDDLAEQFLHETLVTDEESPLKGSTLRCVSGKKADTCDKPTATNVVSSDKGGWRIDLLTTTEDGTQNNAGERVVVNPGAIFASNTVVFETLITGSQSSDACSPSTQGSIMALNAVSGAPAGVSSLGGWPVVGGRINNARTSGNLPVVSALGGGRAYLPGTGLAPSGDTPISVDAPIWRRRSWSEIN